MVQKFKLAPKTSTQSVWSMKRRATECENEPIIPRLLGLPRNISLPRADVISRAPIRSARFSNAWLAPARCAPTPATISGRRLLLRSSAVVEIVCGVAFSHCGGSGITGGFSASSLISNFSSCTLVGNSNAATLPSWAVAAASASAVRAPLGLVARNTCIPAAITPSSN